MDHPASFYLKTYLFLTLNSVYALGGTEGQRAWDSLQLELQAVKELINIGYWELNLSVFGKTVCALKY